MTGFRAAPRSLVKTLTVSQSYGSRPCSAAVGAGNPRADWGGGGPNATASRTPSHGTGGCGAWKRRSPTGGLANGMPRKVATPLPAWSTRPRTRPAAVRTTGSVMSMRGPLAGYVGIRRLERGYATGCPAKTGHAGNAGPGPPAGAGPQGPARIGGGLAGDAGELQAEETIERHRGLGRANRVDRGVGGAERIGLVVHDGGPGRGHLVAVRPVLRGHPGGRAVGVALGQGADHPEAAATGQRQRERGVGGRGEACGEADPAAPVLAAGRGVHRGDRTRAGQEVVDRER